MSIISVEGLTFSYPSSYDNIFENVSLTLDSEWKLGFVGRNGRGKTTFLKLLKGDYEYSGKIISSVEFDYFPYPVADKERITSDILAEICPCAEAWELMRELNLLSVSENVLYRPFSELSNGEQTKVLLAALFLNENHFLLIDEPTNHLDFYARETVAEYLKRKSGFILVSHDRYFLDRCTDHILAINKANIEVTKGNFSDWYYNKELKDGFERDKNEKLKREIKRLNETAREKSDWSDRIETTKIGTHQADRGRVGHLAAKMMKRSKAIEKRTERQIEEKRELLKNIETAEDLKLSPLPYFSDRLVSFSDVSLYYGDREIVRGLNFTVNSGERVLLYGGNGSGKSSILKLITGADIKYSGDVNIGSRLKISYVPQDTSGVFGKLSDFAESAQIDETLFKAILRKLGFERVQFSKDISEFSSGQKKKVLIAKSLCEPAHLYIWDEPLNFIDIYSRMQIERLINEFLPTMLLVEHDKAFAESTATKTVEL